jgi:hypothetical protein
MLGQQRGAGYRRATLRLEHKSMRTNLDDVAMTRNLLLHNVEIHISEVRGEQPLLRDIRVKERVPPAFQVPAVAVSQDW